MGDPKEVCGLRADANMPVELIWGSYQVDIAKKTLSQVFTERAVSPAQQRVLRRKRTIAALYSANEGYHDRSQVIQMSAPWLRSDRYGKLLRRGGGGKGGVATRAESRHCCFGSVISRNR